MGCLAHFWARLPGPFTRCAGAGLSPCPGSLSLALRATSPDLSLMFGCGKNRTWPHRTVSRRPVRTSSLSARTERVRTLPRLLRPSGEGLRPHPRLFEELGGHPQTPGRGAAPSALQLWVRRRHRVGAIWFLWRQGDLSPAAARPSPTSERGCRSRDVGRRMDCWSVRGLPLAA